MGKISKIVVCGHTGVGKTAAIEQLIFGNHVIETPMHPTIEDIYTAMIETDRGVKEKVRIYDIGGLMASNILNAKAPVSKRGNAYECVRCQTTKPVINSYKYVVNHIRKQHLLATQCPYWCTLCDYRCDTQEELAKHVDTYPVHKKIVGIQKTSGVTINPDSFFGHNDMPYFISSDDIVAFSKDKSQEHYSQKRKENGRTAARTVEECLKVPEANTLSQQILAVLPSSEERDEMGEYDAVTVASGDLDNTEVVHVTTVVETPRVDSDNSSTTSSSTSSKSTSKEEMDKQMQNFTSQLNKNLKEASKFINKSFKLGEENVKQLTSMVGEQTKAFNKMANELKGLNQWLRDNNEQKTTDKDNREIRENRESRENHRDSREYRDYRDRRYHPYR